MGYGINSNPVQVLFINSSGLIVLGKKHRFRGSHFTYPEYCRLNIASRSGRVYYVVQTVRPGDFRDEPQTGKKCIGS